MDVADLESLRQELISLCTDVSSFIKEEINKVQSSDIEEKELNSLVSYVDKTAEEKIVSKLKILTPDAGFITEEATIKTESKPLMWIVDPLDGTTNFLYKIPHFSISIALMQEDRVVLGIVYEIMLDVSYTAIKNQGAWENTKRIKVRGTEDTKNAIAVTGFPYRKDLDINASLEVLKYCVLNFRGVRRLGSAALDLAYVASGKIDLYYENALNIWDLAAGALLVEEAGGIVSDYSGSTNYLKHGSIIATNTSIFPKISEVINQHMN